jgi:hypothetical protein
MKAARSALVLGWWSLVGAVALASEVVFPLIGAAERGAGGEHRLIVIVAPTVPGDPPPIERARGQGMWLPVTGEPANLPVPDGWRGWRVGEWRPGEVALLARLGAAPGLRARVLANLSGRADVLPGDGVLAGGFVLQGHGPQPLLIRGIGPTLGAYAVADPMPDPELTVFNADRVPIASNVRWNQQPDADLVRDAAAEVRAFALPEGSADAALLLELAPGLYTAQVRAREGTDQGVALLELYDAGARTGAARLVNLSVRARVGTGERVLIPGLVVDADGPRTFLIRAVGPGLQEFDVVGWLENPKTTLYRGPDPIAENDDWSAGPERASLEDAFARTGAFALEPGSRDSALLVTLATGLYTVVVEGADGGSGIALVEVYVVE